jgi:GT2 family glycosyltransferase
MVNSSSDHPTMAALILARNRPESLAALLKDLGAQTEPPDEIIVVNNYDQPYECSALLSQLAQDVGPIIELSPPAPIGTASGRQCGLGYVHADTVFLLDDDIKIDDHTLLAQLRRMFGNSPDSLVAVTIRDEPIVRLTPLKSVADSISQVGRYLFFLRARRSGAVSAAHFQTRLTTSGPAEWIRGGATVVQSQMARELGFDARLELHPFAIAEDIDLGFRLSRRGHVQYADFLEVRNRHDRVGGTGAEWMGQRLKAYVAIRNYAYLRRKNLPGRAHSVAFMWATVGVVAALTAASLLRRDSAGKRLVGVLEALRDEMAIGDTDRPVAHTGGYDVNAVAHNPTVQ